ncbi:MAG: anthranilate phosphoribosyltransferase [Eubacterium sp.]|nr:anthranilate phosphoribosyltransferase [Eubacterium sp.]
MIKEAIGKLVNGQDLEREEVLRVMTEIMSGEAEQAQAASYLTSLHMKGETVEEISASAEGMRSFARRLDRHGAEVIDIVGTGGDKSNSFNISTAAAVVTSACGVKVAKHGNRAASSKCGTADCLEELGVNIEIEPEDNAKVLQDTNMCFMFAQKYHPAMRYVGPIRKSIGIPTVFNILGPLTNPAYNTHQLLGVYDESLLEPVANALKDLGQKAAMVVYGTDGLDEISLSAPTKVYELRDGEITSYEINPEDYGLEKCSKDELVGGTPEENAKILLGVVKGEINGPKRDAVLLNAGAAIHIMKGVSIKEGIEIAREAIDSGKAYEQLTSFIAATNAVAV